MAFSTVLAIGHPLAEHLNEESNLVSVESKKRLVTFVAKKCHYWISLHVD